ncbi:glycosyltransferase [Luteolibacter luteus]|uniref:Glycosyltransferase family 4 protein n=1 Tax=Luteolibacter luteus TaxID=2728835 RepID=A0A858RBY5_9BACT|nr:glycosyltransferase [Luteolibacter luteus]QJE94287.1 glycosyltransferase family 4 protein [Luteolibacter luteus]
MEKLSICLVSPGHLGSNPRLVKEADALVEAGHRVHVIYGETYAPAIARDADVLAKAKWSSQKVSLFTDRGRGFRWRAGQKLALSLFKKGAAATEVLCRASHPLFPGLRSAALRHKADLYVGHCLPALPVVVAAAARHGSRCAFDAEDFHSGESEANGEGAVSNRLARKIETKFLAKCDHLSAASPLIAKAYEDNYGVKPVTLLNVFPLEEAGIPEAAPAQASFYWFSQTVGAGRGLEEIIAILGKLARPVRLDLRGHVSADYRATLETLAAGSQVEVRLLPPDAPATMAVHATGYTAGLALEKRQPLNRDICLTNKAFTFLLAGIPVVLSKTLAQEALAADLGDAAVLIDLTKPAESAAALAAWLDSSARQTAGREHAIQLGRERFNWDIEKQKLLELIDQIPSVK